MHLKGTFGPSRHAAAYWRERSKAGETVDGRIINTSSPSGIYGNVGQTNYGAAKAGIAAFTIIAAKELARYGVTVNAIAPAALTRMTENLGMGQADEETKEKLSPRWIAPIVTWLASAESPDVTGRVFDVTGQALSVAEGWHRGPTAEPGRRPGPARRRWSRSSSAEARPNANMFGYDEELRSDRCPSTPMPSAPRASPVRHSWTLEGLPALRPRRGRRRRRPARGAGVHHREHRRTSTQQVLPTMAVVLGVGGAGAFGPIGTFNPAMLVHGEQAITLHGPIPVEGEVETVGEITGIYDKGKGAVVEIDVDVRPTPRTGEPLFTHGHVGVHPRRGRLGRRPRPVGPEERRRPTATPDHSVTYATRTDQALLYRLSGDRNPLHSDPAFAAMGGFDRPILHGLCTYGFTGRALLHTLCGADPARFTSMEGRFSSPVLPGRDAHRQRCGTPATARPSSRPSATTAASSSTPARSPSPPDRTSRRSGCGRHDRHRCSLELGAGELLEPLDDVVPRPLGLAPRRTRGTTRRSGRAARRGRA